MHWAWLRVSGREGAGGVFGVSFIDSNYRLFRSQDASFSLKTSFKVWDIVQIVQEHKPSENYQLSHERAPRTIKSILYLVRFQMYTYDDVDLSMHKMIAIRWCNELCVLSD